MGACGIPSGKVFNGRQILSNLEWIKSNSWKRENEMRVFLRSVALLKSQVKLLFPVEVHKTSKILGIFRKKHSLSRYSIQKVFIECQTLPSSGKMSTPAGHRSEQQCGQWTGTWLFTSVNLKKKNLWAPISFLELLPEFGELKNSTRAGCHMRLLALLMVSLDHFVNRKGFWQCFCTLFLFLTQTWMDGAS